MKQRAADRRLFESWKHPIGTPVIVTKDDGSEHLTKTLSNPWLVGDGTPIIKLEGISGGYDLSRVRPVNGAAQ
jgi:hypothetical protein